MFHLRLPDEFIILIAPIRCTLQRLPLSNQRLWTWGRFRHRQHICRVMRENVIQFDYQISSEAGELRGTFHHELAHLANWTSFLERWHEEDPKNLYSAMNEGLAKLMEKSLKEIVLLHDVSKLKHQFLPPFALLNKEQHEFGKCIINSILVEFGLDSLLAYLKRISHELSEPKSASRCLCGSNDLALYYQKKTRSVLVQAVKRQRWIPRIRTATGSRFFVFIMNQEFAPGWITLSSKYGSPALTKIPPQKILTMNQRFSMREQQAIAKLDTGERAPVKIENQFIRWLLFSERLPRTMFKIARQCCVVTGKRGTVVLWYNEFREDRDAPIVIAIGRKSVSKRILGRARRYRICIAKAEELSYWLCGFYGDRVIPWHLYNAVAEKFAWAFKMNKRRLTRSPEKIFGQASQKAGEAKR